VADVAAALNQGVRSIINNQHDSRREGGSDVEAEQRMNKIRPGDGNRSAQPLTLSASEQFRSVIER